MRSRKLRRLAGAATWCVGATAAQSVAARAAYVAAMKTARTTFKAARQDDTKIADTIKNLATTRDAAFKAATTTFTTSTAAARAALKTAFGSAADSV